MNAIAKIEGRFSEAEIDEEMVVMSLETGDFFSLTGTARAIWGLIDGTRDRGALLTALAGEFAASDATIADETDSFLAALVEAGLIRSV